MKMDYLIFLSASMIKAVQFSCSAVTTHPVSPVDEVDGQNFEVRLLLAGVSAFHNVVGDLAASVVLWGVPGQVARVRLDV